MEISKLLKALKVAQVRLFMLEGRSEAYLDAGTTIQAAEAEAQPCLLAVDEALSAVEYAEEVINGCEGPEDLDRASDFKQACADCPEGFSEGQRLLVQGWVLRAYLKSIGRA